MNESTDPTYLPTNLLVPITCGICSPRLASSHCFPLGHGTLRVQWSFELVPLLFSFSSSYSLHAPRGHGVFFRPIRPSTRTCVPSFTRVMFAPCSSTPLFSVSLLSPLASSVPQHLHGQHYTLWTGPMFLFPLPFVFSSYCSPSSRTPN